MTDENQLITERREKLAAIRQQGIAFPNDFKPKHRAAELLRQHDAKTNEELEPLGVQVTVAGRLMLKRVMGKASFGTMQDAHRPHPAATSRIDGVGADTSTPRSSTGTWATSSAQRARCSRPRPAS